jgi:hypothetical protein
MGYPPTRTTSYYEGGYGDWKYNQRGGNLIASGEGGILMNRKISPQLNKPGPLEPVRFVAFMPKTPVKKDKGRKIIVTIVNSIIDLPCLRDSSPCFTDSRASTTPACLYPASVH